MEGKNEGTYLNGGATNRRFHKHEVLSFDGINPDEWILQLEKSFSCYNDEETMEAIADLPAQRENGA